MSKIFFKNYEYVCSLSDDESVVKVKNLIDHKFYVQKRKPIGQVDASIYNYLYRNPIANIPKIIECTSSDDYIFIIEEFIEGKNLSEYFENGESISPSYFFTHIGKLLDIIHDLQQVKCNGKQTIIHRDIKPDNIIINGNELYLIDLDIAKFYNENEEKDTQKLGTVDFAAPEQYGFGASNPRTDIYAIGRIIDLYSSHIDDNNFNKKIKPIIEKCCRLDPNERYKNIFYLKADIFRAKYDLLLFMLPGYRSLNIFHMAIATLFYLLLISYCLLNNRNREYLEYRFVNIKNINVFTFMICISFILMFFNYLNFQRFFPIIKSNNKFVSFISRLFISLIIPLLLSAIYIYTNISF